VKEKAKDAQITLYYKKFPEILGNLDINEGVFF